MQRQEQIGPSRTECRQQAGRERHRTKEQCRRSTRYRVGRLDFEKMSFKDAPEQNGYSRTERHADGDQAAALSSRTRAKGRGRALRRTLVVGRP